MTTKLPLHLINAFLREIQQGHIPDVQQLQYLHCGKSEILHPFSLDDFLTSTNRHGDTPFLVAARHGHVSLLEVLHKEHNVPLEQRNSDRKTALHEAAQNGQRDCIHYLLKEGAMVDSLKIADW